MGTNYYLETGICPECGKPDEVYHIGKSSGGWCFSLHYIPDFCESLDGWKKQWNVLILEAVILDGKTTCRIVNEYGNVFTPEQMEEIITNRSWDRKIEWSQEMMNRNCAEPGPNGLVRHRVDGKRCVANGEGTWDMIAGEFS